MAFIDILGFRELVCSSDQRAEEVEAVAGVLRAISSLGPPPLEVTVFSDSIAISGPDTQVSTVALAATMVGHSLLREAFLPRGGLAIGRLHHRGSIILGPALVHAYDLERTVAKYPRIVVEDEYAQRLLRRRTPIPWHLRLLRDGDGCYFLDLFGFLPSRQWRGVLTPSEFRQHVRDATLLRSKLLANLATEALSPTPNPDRVAKLRWLVREFNTALSRSKSRVRKIDPDLSLPFLRIERRALIRKCTREGAAVSPNSRMQRRAAPDGDAPLAAAPCVGPHPNHAVEALNAEHRS